MQLEVTFGEIPQCPRPAERDRCLSRAIVSLPLRVLSLELRNTEIGGGNWPTISAFQLAEWLADHDPLGKHGS